MSMMEKARAGLSKMPPWLLSLLTFLAILWLTLAPKPLGDEPPQLFPGADKLAHGIMFGGFTIMLLLDYQRKHGWEKISWGAVLFCASLSSLLGFIIELAQNYMGLGRGFEYADIIADAVGAFVFGIIYKLTQNFWLATS